MSTTLKRSVELHARHYTFLTKITTAHEQTTDSNKLSEITTHINLI